MDKPVVPHRMRLIVAGGRDYDLTVCDLSRLAKLCDRIDVTEIVHGDARGVDRTAAAWGKRQGYVVKAFPADWCCSNEAPRHAQGAIRNIAMARYADAVVLFNGGSGTQNMFETAKKHGLRIFDYRAEATARRTLWA